MPGSPEPWQPGSPSTCEALHAEAVSYARSPLKALCSSGQPKRSLDPARAFFRFSSVAHAVLEEPAGQGSIAGS
jgi:hypothetical protein